MVVGPYCFLFVCFLALKGYGQCFVHSLLLIKTVNFTPSQTVVGRTEGRYGNIPEPSVFLFNSPPGSDAHQREDVI